MRYDRVYNFSAGPAMMPESVLEEIAAETAGTALGQKLTDLQLIYEAFQALVELRFHDPLDELALALGRATEKNWFAGRHIWVDSFDYFSVSERALLEQMLLSAESLTLSMTCPALDAGEDIFLYQKKFLLRMRAYAGAHALMCEEPLILTEDKRHQSPDLAGLQRAFTRPETVPPAAGESLRLIEAPTVYEEMRFAAAEISRLVREEGLRYRDCVILCRDLDRYRNAKTVLEEYDLPYFCGEKQNILFAPLPFFLLTALEAASGSLKTAAILRLARSAASGLSPQQAGALENYSFIWNISGEDWLRPFTGNPEGMSDAAPEDYAAALAQVEGARRRVIEPLAALRQSLRNAAGPDFAAAVYRYAEAAGALKNLTQNSPLPQREAVDRQWNSLVDVLDLMTDFYPERALNAREWSELFRLALSRIDLGEVPNTVDHVILAESDRVRLQSPRAVFVLGVNEGIFPANGATAGLFSTREREELNARGAELPVLGTESTLREQFVLYSALSAAAERLTITYARQNIAGDAQLAPAGYLLRVLRPLQVTPIRTEAFPAEFWVVNAATAKSRYAAALGRDAAEEALLAALLERLGEASGALREIARTTQAVSHQLDKVKAGSLEQVYDEAVDNICLHCGLKTRCWQQEYTDTLDVFHHLTPLLRQNGSICEEDFGYPLSARCGKRAQLAQQIGSRMQQISSQIQERVAEAVQQMSAQIAGRILEQAAEAAGTALSVDTDALADAVTMNLEEEDLAGLFRSLMSAEDSSYEGNLEKFGYADPDSPDGIDIYPLDFESKAAVLDILDSYNQRMRAEDQDDKVISYTDMTGMLMSSVTEIVDTVSYVLIAFVATSLVVSSIMIGVITYISVLERRKEIGILRAIGASRRNISQVFNAKTFIIGLCAGVIGIVLTLLILIPGNALLHTLIGSEDVHASLPAVSGIVLVLLSILLTLVGGLIPSKKAAKSDPVKALRAE